MPGLHAQHNFIDINFFVCVIQFSYCYDFYIALINYFFLGFFFHFLYPLPWWHNLICLLLEFPQKMWLLSQNYTSLIEMFSICIQSLSAKLCAMGNFGVFCFLELSGSSVCYFCPRKELLDLELGHSQEKIEWKWRSLRARSDWLGKGAVSRYSWCSQAWNSLKIPKSWVRERCATLGGVPMQEYKMGGVAFTCHIL